MELNCDIVDVVSEGGGCQVLFENSSKPDTAFALLQRHFEEPDDGRCYFETHDQEMSGHFDIEYACLSVNTFEFKVGVNGVIISFTTSPRNYSKLKHVLKEMIPTLRVI